MLGMTNVAIQMALLLKSLFSRDRLASASSLGTLPTRDLLLCSRLLFCFVLFLNLGCISVEYHFVVHLYRRNLFLSFSIASSKVEILFSCSLFLHEDLFFLYSLTNLSALALSDSLFGLILALIMTSLTLSSVLESMKFGIISQTHLAQNPVPPKQHA